MRKRIKTISSNVLTELGTYLGIVKNVYFISGMCYNCSVFDNIILPRGFRKHYIEWEIPILDESLEDYAMRMAKSIKRKGKIILVGYSFGGVIVQEIAKFMKVDKIILISTMKNEVEIPQLFRLAKKINFADNIPMRLYSQSDFMINLFNKYVYNVPTKAFEGFMTVTDPVYIRWALRQITHWVPTPSNCSIYHIHGTKDQVFPYEQVLDPITVKGGDHLMVIKRTGKINDILNSILLATKKQKEIV